MTAACARHLWRQVSPVLASDLSLKSAAAGTYGGKTSPVQMVRVVQA